MSTAMAVRPKGFVVDVRSLAEAMEFATMMSKTDMVPDNDRGKPGNILAKMQIGAEIGLPPMQAINTLYVQKGKVGMEVKAMLALVQASGQLEDKIVAWETAPQGGACTVTVKRFGRSPYAITFGPKEAEKAGLLGGSKDTYKKWDWRMFYNRAMGFALQDEFQDVLRGVVSYEYLQDGGVAIEGDVDGRGVSGTLETSAEAALENKARKMMAERGFPPGKRLAKMTAYRGRLEALIAELEQMPVPPKTEAPKQLEEAPIDTLPVEEPVIQVREPELVERVSPAEVAEALGAEEVPACPSCKRPEMSNPNCDTCLDMQLAKEEQ
ncbi:MAG: hypothetical protein AB7P99_15445 [Vicinamibacterales bacterium]